MPTFKIDTPDGASYDIEAQDESQLQSFIARITGKKAYSDPTETDPSNAEYQAKYGPTRGFVGNVVDALGKAGSKFSQGVMQLNELVGTVSPSPIDRNVSRANLAALHQQTANEQETDRYLDATGGGAVGSALGMIGTSAPAAFIPGANTYVGTGLIGGALGAVQPVTNERDRAVNTGVGTAVSLAAKYGLDRLGSSLASRAGKAQANASASASSSSHASASGGVAANETTIQAAPTIRAQSQGAGFGSVGDDIAGNTSAQKKIMEDAKKLGFRMTPGQATGSRALQQMEAKLESQPMTSGAFNKVKINNARALNRTVAKAIGVESDVVDSAALDRAFRKTAAVFDDVSDDSARSIEPKKFVEIYRSIQDDLEGLYEGFSKHPLVKRLVNLAEGGNATGKQLQSLSSKLSRAAYKNMSTPSGDRDLGLALYRVKDYVDDLLQGGLSQGRLSAFKTAREHYRNLMLITSRVGVVNTSTGNVSGANLANVLQARDKAGFLRGSNQSDMYTAARFSQAFKPIVGDSGTATRGPIQGPTDFVLSLPFNVATRAYTSSPSINAIAGAQSAANAAGTAGGNALFRAHPTLQKYVPPLAGRLASTVSNNELRDRR